MVLLNKDAERVFLGEHSLSRRAERDRPCRAPDESISPVRNKSPRSETHEHVKKF